MKRILLAALAALTLAPTLAMADDLRHGVVMQIKPIDNRGDDESEQHQTGRKIGRGLGALAGALSLGAANNTATNLAVRSAPEVGDSLGGKVAGQGPSAHYMVTVKLTDGRTLSLVQPGPQVNGLEQGSHVFVSGSGDTAVIKAE
ncbi:MAG: hypothetical protein GAK28_04647 [Luteibacter sp.]|uniref:hypothetical protein n=1 Tax=Luteibacter sp. TaxID=1886636 RepID=UPI0013835E1A|nr:hypothetical protein [Luteibacter sp.]KAF1003511.1 MAG: hypothetical protein GAK28_04647 [Luteibacter sp.]